MARYKYVDKSQGLFITVDLQKQLIPGTFEHTLNELIDKKLDLSIFDQRYKNDETGATAIEPRVLLKIIIYCYSLGIITSRKIARMCETHMVVKALANDIEPHYTTISNFVSTMSGEVEVLFTEILMVCQGMGLIEGKMFAIDGCRLPSNAAKEWSGTKKELEKKYNRIKSITKKIIAEHKKGDIQGADEEAATKKKLKRMEKEAARILEFLSTHEKRIGAGGKEIQMNITDNESGKIKGPHGMIQGYNGLAAADGKNQVIVAAGAYGSAAEGPYFAEMVDKIKTNMQGITEKEEPLKKAIILADTAYFSEENLQAAKEKGVKVIIPDQQFRQRDEQLSKGERRKGKEQFDARDFKYKKKENWYICPNGKKLLFKREVTLNRNHGMKYESKTTDCRGCPYFEKCISARSKKKKYRTLYIPVSDYDENLSEKMRDKIDDPKYKKIYGHRMQIIEPVFADITYCKGISRFTLRTKMKVTIQWLLYCIVHNIGKCSMAERMKYAI
jgi:transposase